MTSSAPPSRAISVPPRRSGSAWRLTATSISTNIPAGIRCATKPITTRAKPGSTTRVRGWVQTARRSNGSRRRAISFGCLNTRRYFFKLYQDVPDFVLPKERMNEVASFVRGGLQDLSLSRTTFDWGIKVPGNDKHIMYVWVDALTNYITAVGFPRHRKRNVRKILAVRFARDRQGHRALSRRVLAGIFDLGRDRGAAADFLARLSVQPRRENVEVGRQRDRSVRAGRRLWRRSVALFPAARSAVRPGRQLQPRSDRQPHQCRSRQRSRQSGAALAVDGGAQSRRRPAEAGGTSSAQPIQAIFL